jgi:hypothetical protein
MDAGGYVVGLIMFRLPDISPNHWSWAVALTNPINRRSEIDLQSKAMAANKKIKNNTRQEMLLRQPLRALARTFSKAYSQ